MTIKYYGPWYFKQSSLFFRQYVESRESITNSVIALTEKQYWPTVIDEGEITMLKTVSKLRQINNELNLEKENRSRTTKYKMPETNMSQYIILKRSVPWYQNRTAEFLLSNPKNWPKVFYITIDRFDGHVHMGEQNSNRWRNLFENETEKKPPTHIHTTNMRMDHRPCFEWMPIFQFKHRIQSKSNNPPISRK